MSGATRVLTMADFPRGFTLRALIVDYCDRDEALAWEKYFNGGMDETVRNLFEGCINPLAKTVAVIMRAAVKEMKK